MYNANRLLPVFALFAALVWPAQAAELVTLHPGNFADYAPRGKEADAIFGDYVLCNDRITVAVADPTLKDGRSSSRKMGMPILGAIIDLVRNDAPNDMLHAFHPVTRNPTYFYADIPDEPGTQSQCDDSALAWKKPGRAPQQAKRVVLRLPLQRGTGEVRYILEDGWDHVLAELELRAAPKQDRVIAAIGLNQLLDAGPRLRKQTADLLYDNTWVNQLAWYYDQDGGQAYGAWSELPVRNFLHESWMRQGVNRDLLVGDVKELRIPASQTLVWRTAIFPAADAFAMRKIATRFTGEVLREQTLILREGDAPAPEVLVLARDGQTLIAAGRSTADGHLGLILPAAQDISLEILPFGRPKRNIRSPAGATDELAVTLPKPARLRGEVRDQDGHLIPAKLTFTGIGETPQPVFGPATATYGVGHLRYTNDGRFDQIVPPGNYRLRVTRGPEYEHFERDLVIPPESDQELAIVLPRVVNTEGWISADFNNRSTISRPFSYATVEGRLVNLLAEQIEFAPATESDKVYDYAPHLRALGGETLLATCPGIGLTQRTRKAWNSQVSFPLRYVPGAQDGGARQRPAHVSQVFWLGSAWYGDLNTYGNLPWNDPDDKLIIVTPPGIWPQDGRSDGMYRLFYPFITRFESPHRNQRLTDLRRYDAMEVQPLHVFADMPDWSPADPLGEADQHAWWTDLEARRAANWPQLSNRQREYFRILRTGVRVTGVACNTDSDNLNGSSRWRTWVKSATDAPGQISPQAVVRAVRLGQTVMSSGPFLTLQATAGEASAGPGDDLAARGGKFRLNITVQAPSRLTIERVVLLINGLRYPEHDYRREAQPELFAQAVSQFSKEIELALPVDSFVTAYVAGVESCGGDQTQDHQALATPFFVDVDGDGFTPHHPVDDQVFTLLDPLEKLTHDTPAKLRLYLYNHGSVEAVGVAQIEIRKGDAEISDKGLYAYRLAPGQQLERDFLVTLTSGATGGRVELLLLRKSDGVGHRPAGLVWKVNSAVTSWTSMTANQRRHVVWHPGWLSETRVPDFDASPRTRELRRQPLP